MGDKNRRLRRLSTKSITPASTASKDSPGTNEAKSEQTPVARKRRESKGSRHNGVKDTKPKTTGDPEPTAEIRSTQASKQDDVNVFAFMEKDEASNAADTDQSDSDVPVLSPSSSSSSHSGSPLASQLQSPYSDLEVHATENKEGILWYDNYRRDHSLNSDSGISMLSTSPAGGSPESVFRKRVPRSDDGTPTTSHNGVMGGLMTTSMPENPAARISHIPSLDSHFMEEPESYYSSSPQTHSQTPNTATTDYHQAGLQPSSQPVVQQPSPGSISAHLEAQAQNGKSSYDLLASAIDSRHDSSLMPIYRKFETLNNRILLYLQDEISEMEDALKRLDAAITEEDGQVAPAMGPMHAYPSQYKWHRQELMCRLLTKVEQYSTLSLSRS